MDSAWNTTFSTSLPDGLYCDVISGTNSSSGKCTGIRCVNIQQTDDSLFFFDVVAIIIVSLFLRVHSTLQYLLEALSLFIPI